MRGHEIASDGQAEAAAARVGAARYDERCPTVSFTLGSLHPRTIAEALGARGIFSWDGDYYAYELIRALGLVHYNTLDEIDRLVEALKKTPPADRRLTGQGHVSR